MIVVDTNVIVYLTLPSEFTSAADVLFQKDRQWAAPLLWRSEFRNALSLYLRKSLLTIDEACRLQSEAESVMAGNEHQVDSSDVLRLAAASGQTAYDCEYISLAQRLGVPLVTIDKKLLRAFPSIAIALDAATA